jgi:hypothetical protein
MSWQSLTDKEILEKVKAAPALGTAEAEWLHVCRAVESSLREKNAKPAERTADSEPVDEAEPYSGGSADHTQAIFHKGKVPVGTKLYAHPQPDTQYPLPDDLYPSKDWRAGSYAERVEWLHVMYESKKSELVDTQDNVELLRNENTKLHGWINAEAQAAGRLQRQINADTALLRQALQRVVNEAVADDLDGWYANAKAVLQAHPK